MTGLAVAFALLSAFTVAFSTSLQHQAAELAPRSVTGAWGLLRHLVGRPLWLFGQVLGTLAFVFHALALHNGPLALVQPLVVSGIVLAVGVRAAMARQLPGAAELGAVLLAAAGLAVFLVVSAPSPGRESAVGMTALVAVVICLLVAAAAVTGSQRIANPTRRAFLLGAGAGILFALVAVLLKLSLTTYADSGAVEMLATWPPYLLVVTGLGGVLCNQFAYRASRLSSSMPVLNVVDCLVALFFGYVVLDEMPRHSPGALVAEVLALVAMLSGLWILARDVGAAVSSQREVAGGGLVPVQRTAEPRAEAEPTHSPGG